MMTAWKRNYNPPARGSRITFPGAIIGPIPPCLFLLPTLLHHRIGRSTPSLTSNSSHHSRALTIPSQA